MNNLDGNVVPVVIGKIGPESLARLNVSIACPKDESAGSVSLVVNEKEEMPDTWEIRTTAESEPPLLATVSLGEGELRLTPKPSVAKTPVYQRLLSRSALLFATEETGSPKEVFLCIPTSSPKTASNPTACPVTGSTTIGLNKDSYLPPLLRTDDATRMHCTLQWSSGGKPSEARVTFRQGKNKAGTAPTVDTFVAPVEIDGRAVAGNYPIPLLGLGLGEASVALKAEADFKNGIIRVVTIIAGKEVPSWLTLENLASQKCGKVLDAELDSIKKSLAKWDPSHREQRRAIPSLESLFKTLSFEKKDEEKALALCDQYTIKHGETLSKYINDPQYLFDKARGMKEWQDFAKEQEAAFDELKELALDKARQLHDAFAKLQDVQFKVDRIESDAWLENKAYPVPLFIAADNNSSPAETPSGVTVPLGEN